MANKLTFKEISNLYFSGELIITEIVETKVSFCARGEHRSFAKTGFFMRYEYGNFYFKNLFIGPCKWKCRSSIEIKKVPNWFVKKVIKDNDIQCSSSVRKSSS